MSRFWTIFLVLLALGAAAFLFLVEPGWESTREHLATRDVVLTVDPLSIRAIRVISGDDGFELERKDDGWHVGPKPKDLASPDAVARLLAATSALRVYDAVRADEVQSGRRLDDFGLEKPRSRIEVEADRKTTIFFGKDAAGDNRIYVRRDGSDDVYVVDDALQRLAFRNADDFRDRRLSAIAPDRVDRFSIKRDDGEIALERGSRGWNLVKPLRARADSAAVDRLLGEMLGLPILKFVADESNDLGAFGARPRAEIVFQLDDEERPVALRLAGAPESGGNVLAQFTARDSVYELPAKAWQALQVTPDQLRDRRLLDLNLDTVDAIRLRRGDRERVLTRDGEGWRDERGVEIAASQMEKFSQALLGAKVERYLPLTDAARREAGIGAPEGSITFEALLSENTPETTAGRRVVARVEIGRREGDNVFVRVNDEPEIAVIPAAVLDATP